MLSSPRQWSRPVRRLFAKILVRSPVDLGRLFRLTMSVHGYRLHLRKSAISLTLFRNPDGRTTDHQFIIDYVQEHDIFLDVGANIGTTLIPAAQIVGDGIAIGFEPHPIIFRFLAENIELNGLQNKTVLHNCALGDSRGQLGFSSVQNDDRNRIVETSSAPVHVPVELLDDFTRELPSIALLKIDVEGYEKFVFQGGQETLAKTSCVYFEVSEQHFHEFGYGIRDLLELLEAQGFQIFSRVGPTSLQPETAQYKPSGHHENLIAIRSLSGFEQRTGWSVVSRAT